MSNPERQVRLAAILITLGSFSLYILTLAPTVQGFDSAELTMGAYDLGFVHPTGYPLYLLIGRLFSRLPLGEVGYRLNLASAVFASLAAGVLCALAYRQTRDIGASLVAAALFAATPIFWSQAIRAEVYSLQLFLMFCALYAWLKAYQDDSLASYLFAFLTLGLGLANHLTSALLWVAVLACSPWLGRKFLRATLPASLLGLVLGALFYLYFPLRAQASLQIDYIRPYFPIDPGRLNGVLWMISGQAFRCLVIQPDGLGTSLGELLRLGGELLKGTLGFGLALSIPGWIVLNKSAPVWNRLLTLYFAANLAMYLAYGAIDKQVMFIPLYAIVCLWCASGIQALARWVVETSKGTAAFIHLFLYAALLGVILAGVWLDWRVVSLRDDRRAYEFARQVLAQAGPQATIVSHWATASVFDYLRIVEAERSDVSSFNVDFYFLGLQQGCQPVTHQQMLASGWIDWLLELSERKRLCYIEPLHSLPEAYQWRNQGLCWHLVQEAP